MSDESNTQVTRPAFHLAIPVDDLAAARHFYGEVLGCPQGRSDTQWVDWNLFGHQVVTHQVQQGSVINRNPVDGDAVPVPHFGVVLTIEKFHALADRLKAADIRFEIEPHVRFAGEIGEQWTMFFCDPAGNPLEFKAFADEARLFAH